MPYITLVIVAWLVGLTLHGMMTYAKGIEMEEQVQVLSDKLDTLTTNVESAKARISADVQGLKDEIERLQQDDDALDLSALIAKVDSIDAAIAGIDPVPDAPPAP